MFELFGNEREYNCRDQITTELCVLYYYIAKINIKMIH